MQSSMRDIHFIFVEGIMGAGKSTTAAFLTDQLRRNGIAARFVPEGPSILQPRWCGVHLGWCCWCGHA